MSILRACFINTRIYIYYLLLFILVYLLSGCVTPLRPYVPVDKSYSLRSPDFVRWTQSSPL